MYDVLKIKWIHWKEIWMHEIEFSFATDKFICLGFYLTAFQRLSCKQHCFVLSRLGTQMELRTQNFFAVTSNMTPMQTT